MCSCCCCCCLVAKSVWLFVTPWTAACQASLSFTISQSFLKRMSIELMMPSNRLILCCPLLLLPSVFPSIRVFSNESALHIRWSQYWSFSFTISPPNEYSGLISLRTDWIDLLCSRDLINFPRSPQENACCVWMILEVKPQTNMSCESSVSHEQHLLLGSMSSIYCPGLSHQSDAQSPEVTWYQVRITSLNLMPEFVFMVIAL